MGMVSTQLILGDCLEVMQGMEPNSIHSIICDPPYGLSFMGKDWDHGVPGVAFWEAALRVAKPGAMLLAFGGTRTFHRLTVAIEDAGWEIRDCLMWLYGSGFPKSHSIDKAIDKAAGAEREVIGPKMRPDDRAMIDARANGFNGSHEGWDRPWKHDRDSVERQASITAPATDAARQWAGWGTSLKPAFEPIIMAMKPLDGTFANNALVHGVAGINVDACRIGFDVADREAYIKKRESFDGMTGKPGGGWKNVSPQYSPEQFIENSTQGRWPANLLLDEEAAAMLDQMSGVSKSPSKPVKQGGHHRHDVGLNGHSRDGLGVGYGDIGGASRFFYCAKASKRDRSSDGVVNNTHPTCKPSQLMKYLCRLVCVPGGTILDPFCGSGSTGVAAALEGFNFVGIELEPEYLSIAERRIAHAQAQVEKPTQTQPALLEVS